MGSDSVIFIDLGAFDGRSVRAYEKTRDITFAQLWEPNPHVRLLPPKCNHIKIDKAASVADGNASMYLSNPMGRVGQGQGSTLYKEKCSGFLDYGHPMVVETADFAAHLANLRGLTQRDIVVKMNVEGAEYDIIPHLAAQSALDIPTEWYISFHNWKVGRTEDDDEELRELFRLAGYRDFGGRPFPEPEFEGWAR